MMKWEYLVETFDRDDTPDVPDGAQNYLNRKGLEGWELTNVSSSFRTYFFKRLLAVTTEYKGQ